MPTLNRVERRSEHALRPGDKLGDPLLNSGQKREYLGRISPMTDWRWSKKHGLPPPDVVVGRRGYWRLSTIERWIKLSRK